MQDQLMLMEKSYEMASRYFPAVKSSAVKDGQKKRTEDTLLKIFQMKNKDTASFNSSEKYYFCLIYRCFRG